MKQNWRIFIFSILACALLIGHNYVACPDFYDIHLARRLTLSPTNELYRWLYSFGATFVTLGLVPAVIGCVLWNEKPSEWGLTLGQNKAKFLLLSLVIFAAAFPLLIYASGFTSIASFHPLSRLAVKYRKAFIMYECCLLLYMAGWEFFFRGFLLSGLKKVAGESAMFLQLIPYVIMHLERSAIEALAAIPIGFLLGYLANRSGSVWYGVGIHWMCALALDFLLVFRPF